MSDEPRFIAKSSNKPTPKQNGFVAKYIHKTPSIPTFDLTQRLSLQQLAKNLEASINSDKPSSCWFLWGGERQNKRLQLDIEHQRLIIEQIRDLGLAAEQMATTQAKLFLMPEVVDNIIQGHRAQVELAAKEFMSRFHAIDVEMEEREIRLDAQRIANLRAHAEVNLMNAHSQEAKAKADLIRFVVDSIDVKSMPPTLQSYVVASIVNPQGSQFNDFDMQERLKEYIEEEAKQKALQAKAQTRLIQGDANIARAKSQKTVEDIETIRNKPKGK